MYIGFAQCYNYTWQDWETETLDIELSLVGREEELGLDLAGGRDDGESPVYISAIHKVL